ncbi:MAG: histidine triad nucleotide-binding protein [Clostridiales bacterium]|jgi:histidine triad (HIT) family protein|nr:histidine triad nucleotide-binding protein [Clostridiales bacterium]
MCIFCEIANKNIDSKIVYEDDFCIAFNDVAPAAPTHVLVIPKQHVANVNEASSELLSRIMQAVKEVVKALGISEYRLISNCGESSGQTVFHLHFHILGGKNLGKLCD